jgi:hypothetical protein
MTDEQIAQQIADAVMGVLRSAQRTTQSDVNAGPFISPSQATAICGRSESQVRRDCAANPIDDGGFGLKIGGRWLVSEPRYREMRGNARMRV